MTDREAFIEQVRQVIADSGPRLEELRTRLEGLKVRSPVTAADVDNAFAAAADVAWHSDDATAALLADHPFPFVRATSRESLTRRADEAHRVAECYFRRDENGKDSALLLQ